MKKTDIAEIFKSKKMIAALAVLAALGAIMIISSGGDKNNSIQSDPDAEYIRAAENKIEQTVGAICGGDVYVIVTLEYGTETQYAKTASDGSGQTVISSGAPVPARTAGAVVRGISVVCRNGGDPVIQKRITDALSCAYGVSSARIHVAPIGK